MQKRQQRSCPSSCPALPGRPRLAGQVQGGLAVDVALVDHLWGAEQGGSRHHLGIIWTAAFRNPQRTHVYIPLRKASTNLRLPPPFPAGTLVPDATPRPPCAACALLLPRSCPAACTPARPAGPPRCPRGPRLWRGGGEGARRQARIYTSAAKMVRRSVWCGLPPASQSRMTGHLALFSASKGSRTLSAMTHPCYPPARPATDSPAAACSALIPTSGLM